MAIDIPKTRAIAPWFGCARKLAAEVGELLRHCRWVGIPFAGGLPEVIYLPAQTIVAADLHRHVINLARAMADPIKGASLYRRLRRLPCCREVLTESQAWLKENPDRPIDGLDETAAYHYFIASWMGRSAKAGAVDEWTSPNVSLRWNARGGDSVLKFRSAANSIPVWRRVLSRVTLLVVDCFEFLAHCQDLADHGIYADPPFPGPGEQYKHALSEADHRKLARVLAGFHKARVVCRFYDHPLIRELYPEEKWLWRRYKARNQRGAAREDLLLTNERGRRLF